MYIYIEREGGRETYREREEREVLTRRGVPRRGKRQSSSSTPKSASGISSAACTGFRSAIATKFCAKGDRKPRHSMHRK